MRRGKPSDFCHWPSNKQSTDLPRGIKEDAIALLLPLNLPRPCLHLEHVEHSIQATCRHFSFLELDWKIERSGNFGDARAEAILKSDKTTGDLWTLVVLESAALDKHLHNPGGAYGEFIIGLQGELDDRMDNGTPVRIGAGSVMFHAGKTVHQPSAPLFWAGIFHQPRGFSLVA